MIGGLRSKVNQTVRLSDGLAMQGLVRATGVMAWRGAPDRAIRACWQAASGVLFRSEQGAGVRRERRNCEMDLRDKVIVITGAAAGIGAALARRFARAGAKGIAVADLAFNRAALEAVAQDIGGIAVACDVAKEADIKALVSAAEARWGQVDVFFSNAGIGRAGHEDASDADWDASWRIHVLSHVFAARAVLPGMLARGEGYLVNTASAAGLLASMGSAPYGVTKHAAVALAEHLAIQYGDRGIRVSCLCPQAVDTALFRNSKDSAAAVDGIATPEAVADEVVRAMGAEEFLILSHKDVREYMVRKATSIDRWLGGMRVCARRSRAEPRWSPTHSRSRCCPVTASARK